MGLIFILVNKTGDTEFVVFFLQILFFVVEFLKNLL